MSKTTVIRVMTREQLKEGIRQTLEQVGPPQVIKDIRRELNTRGRDLVVTDDGMRATVDGADLVATEWLRDILSEILGETLLSDA